MVLLDTLVRPINGALVALLRSPAHRVASGGLMAITYDGRRSGETFSTPVGYQVSKGSYWVLLSTPATKSWWKNFREAWPAALEVRGETIPVTGHVVEVGSDDFYEHIETTFRRLPWLSRQFKLKGFDRLAGLTAEDRQVLLTSAAVVRFQQSG